MQPDTRAALEAISKAREATRNALNAVNSLIVGHNWNRFPVYTDLDRAEEFARDLARIENGREKEGTNV